MDVTEAVLRHLDIEARIAPEPMLRAMLLCYLIDWKGALETGRQILPLEWVRSGSGPFAKGVVNSFLRLRLDQRDELQPTSPPRLLGDVEAAIIEHTRNRYRGAKIESLLQLANSTYPMLYGESERVVDLATLAELYKQDFAVDIQKSKERETVSASFG